MCGEGQERWHLEPEREAEAELWRTLSTMQGSEDLILKGKGLY